MSRFVPISYQISACNCPCCGAYSQQNWCSVHMNDNTWGGFRKYDRFTHSICFHCEAHSLWLDEKMIYPLSGSVQSPNQDMPPDIKDDYNEARSIVELSPRGAVAILRLCVQKLCRALGEKGENINHDIKQLVSKGLPLKLQQALDSVRVVGNNAVHPGQIDLKDDRETAYKLFAFLNVIVDILITQPNQIDEFYNTKLPDGDRAAISRRDNASQ